MEFDRRGVAEESAQWRWYIGVRKGPWLKTRRRAKLDLKKELLVKKESKKDPDILRTDLGPWTYGPDRYFERNP